MTLSLTSTACFDVQTVDPGPAVLDDFEDNDLIPSLRSFGEWSCALDKPTTPLRCDLPAGFQSSHSLSVEFSIVDPPGGGPQGGVVQLETDSDTPIDLLTGTSAITFDVRLTNAPPPAPSGPNMRLQLRCSTAVDENGAQLRDYVVVQSLPYTDEWSSPPPLGLSSFGPAEWLPGTPRGGTDACLRAVDGFQFVFDPQVADGQTVAGVLSIDNIRLLR